MHRQYEGVFSLQPGGCKPWWICCGQEWQQQQVESKLVPVLAALLFSPGASLKLDFSLALGVGFFVLIHGLCLVFFLRSKALF